MPYGHCQGICTCKPGTSYLLWLPCKGTVGSNQHCEDRMNMNMEFFNFFLDFSYKTTWQMLLIVATFKKGKMYLYLTAWIQLRQHYTLFSGDMNCIVSLEHNLFSPPFIFLDFNICGTSTSTYFIKIWKITRPIRSSLVTTGHLFNWLEGNKSWTHVIICIYFLMSKQLLQNASPWAFRIYDLVLKTIRQLNCSVTKPPCRPRTHCHGHLVFSNTMWS